MQLFYLIHILTFFVFIFSLYIFSHDDYILLKRNVSMEKVLDFAFEIFIVFIFFARLFYVIFNYSPKFLNPLTFILFPYSQGLSLPGGIIGIAGFVYIFLATPKIPISHLFDFFSLSFLVSLPFGLLIQNIYFAITRKTFSFFMFLEAIFFTILAILIIRIYHKVKLEEGSIGFLSLALFSFLSLIFNIIEKWKNLLFLSEKDNFLLIVIFLVSLIFFIKREKLFNKIKK